MEKKPIEKLYSTVDSLMTLDFLRKGLKKIHPLRGDYRFGQDKNIRVRHNLIDELVNKMTEKIYFNRYQEINPKLKIGTKFGKRDNILADLTLGKNNVKFDLGVKF